MIKTIILDLDGPILDGKLKHYQCYRDILLENGYHPLPLEDYWGKKRRRMELRDQLASSGAEEICETFLQTWLRRIETKEYLLLDRLRPEAVDRLEEWKALAISLFLVTMRRNRDSLGWQLDSLKLPHFFDQIIVAEPNGGEEQKAAMVKTLGETINPEVALWIGDTEVDIKAAKRLGIKAYAVGCGLRTPEYLASFEPDCLAENLAFINIFEEGQP